jgi:hypothetical protein
MKLGKIFLIGAILISLLPSDLAAEGLGESVSRAAARALARKAFRPSIRRAAPKVFRRGSRPSIQRTLRLDRLRDARTKPLRLVKPRTVYRFTTVKQAHSYSRAGVPAGTHFTSAAGRGRPLSAISAQKRYGLPAKPSARVTVKLLQGTRIKTNKVIGGSSGYGEVKTYRKKLPPTALKKIVPVH